MFIGIVAIVLALGLARHWLASLHEDQHRRTLEAQARYDSAKYQSRTAPPRDST